MNHERLSPFIVTEMFLPACPTPQGRRKDRSIQRYSSVREGFQATILFVLVSNLGEQWCPQLSCSCRMVPWGGTQGGHGIPTSGRRKEPPLCLVFPPSPRAPEEGEREGTKATSTWEVHCGPEDEWDKDKMLQELRM